MVDLFHTFYYDELTLKNNIYVKRLPGGDHSHRLL